MKKSYPFVLILVFLTVMLSAFRLILTKEATPATFLAEIKTELTKEWPKNKAINLVFHGHSVPAGYFKTPVVNTLNAYPNQTLKLLKERYPNAVINVIVTAIGGEDSDQGAIRFQSEVLPHKPDVLFIDYGLNDRAIGLEKAKENWQKMIEMAQKVGVKVILLTPSPDLKVEMSDPENQLNLQANQIRQLAKQYNTGLVDSYEVFDNKRRQGQNLDQFMSQRNHPNEAGHTLITNEIIKWF